MHQLAGYSAVGDFKPIWYWIHARGVKNWWSESKSVWDAVPVAVGPVPVPAEYRRPSCRSRAAKTWPEWTIVADCRRVCVPASNDVPRRKREKIELLFADRWQK